MPSLKTVKTPRIKSPKPPIPLLMPKEITDIGRWLVVGLDPSLSRTGYALMWVWDTCLDATTEWLAVGSLKPDDASEPVWVRSKAIALALRAQIVRAVEECDLTRTGLIISLEAPTPRNDFLSSINRILHLVLLQDAEILRFNRIYIQQTNASTLRSLMGLKATGAKNKVENVTKAYSFLDKGEFPNLDTDACDAVLMAMMGRYSAAILLGDDLIVPPQFLTKLCDGRQEPVGKGLHKRTRTVGILHRPEYWVRYQRQPCRVLLRDARVKKARLDRFEVSI